VNLARIIEDHPADHVALISRGKTTTYGELREQVARFRGGLTGLGIGAGDPVGVLCANNWYFVASYLAVIGLGAVAVPLNPSSPAPEIERELGAVEAKLVIAGPRGSHSLANVRMDRVPAMQQVVCSAGAGIASAVGFDDVLAAAPQPVAEVDSSHLAALMFTSGTAGRPKAAMLTHGNLLANINQLHSLDGSLSADDVSLGVLPLFHIFGLNAVLGSTLAAGAQLLLMERFDPVSALESVQRRGVTVLAGAPTMWTAWANLAGVDPTALSGVRIATSGSAKLPAEIASRIETTFGVTVTEGYGLTEASPVVTSSLDLEPRYGSIGMPLPGVEVRLVDADGEDALVGDAGEVWVRGPNVFAGYWRDDEATRRVLTPEGWLRTGDMAVVDDDGFLFLVDRAKDLIIVSGFNVFPAEVEDVLILHPGIDACAVVGVAHPYSGEAVKAYVVVAEGHEVEEDEVIEWCAEHLARYKCPDKVMFVDELPQGLSGKVLRRALT
jgi:long-chain acyl-CoA synthetase